MKKKETQIRKTIKRLKISTHESRNYKSEGDRTLKTSDISTGCLFHMRNTDRKKPQTNSPVDKRTSTKGVSLLLSGLHNRVRIHKKNP